MGEQNRRPLGFALLTSAVLMLSAAALSWTGVLPVPLESRALVAGTLLAATVVDLVLGFRFLRSTE